ncbi:MAG: hypothetical protein IT580_18805, partial [Verrucomicrobiales bacterium]|nr:hypothetical protein [Verrucomicrobiales bacterium]
VVPGISGAGYQPPLAQVGLSADVSNLVFERTAPSLQATRDTVSGRWVFTANGTPHRTYRLEGGSQLSRWETLATTTADAAGRVRIDYLPPTAASGFFRLSEL